MAERRIALVIGVALVGVGLYEIDRPWLTFAVGAVVALIAFGSGLPSKSDTGAKTDG